ncbi:MAG TPA: HEAT repeat domain-containing protein [Solirubrobacteraceae bacterium]|nr:HEAT repeat domain-containing protein [Solirubrobacteraceae bacterium]
MGLPSELGAAPRALDLAGRRQRDRWWAPLIVLPYVGLVGGAVALAGVREQAFERLWWLAPAALLACVCLLLLTIGAMTRRRRRARASGQELETLALTIREALVAGEGDRRQTVESLLDRLPEVSAVSRGLSEPERAILRATLDEVGASAAVERSLARSRTKWGRAAALRTLGWLADERSLPALHAALRGPDPDLAFVAGQSLAEYDSAQACSCLVEALCAGWPSRPVIATLLEGARYADSETLVAAAAHNRDPDVRSWVAYLLGRSRMPAAGAWLRRLASDSEPEVRASAAEADAAFHDDGLLRSLLADADWRVRANAAKAIGDAAGPAGLAADLAPLLRDRVWWVRQKATISLKLLGAASIVSLRPLLDDEDRFARNKAAEVLIEVGYAASQIAALHGRPADLADARDFLRRLAGAEGRATIRAGVDSTDLLIRKRLIELLGEVGERVDDRDDAPAAAVATATLAPAAVAPAAVAPAA